MQLRDRITDLKRIKASDLAPHPKNWRTHPREQRDALRGVLAEIGIADALLVRETKTGYQILDGHCRAEETPDTEWPCLVVDLTDEEAEKLLATHDPIAAMAEADAEVLRELLAGVETENDAVAKMLEAMEREAGIGLPSDEFQEAPEAQVDKAEELRSAWGVKRGQIWRCGRHRVMCGDSTHAGDVDRLLGGEKCALCLTDPPYGVGVNYVKTDDTRENLAELVGAFMPIALSVADVVLLTPGNGNQYAYPEPKWTLCWFIAAGTGMAPWGFQCWHPVLAYGKDPYLAQGLGARPDATTITESSPDLNHPCPKPEGVWRWLLERGSVNKDDSVYDPFLGSGTTLVACEQIGRTGYGIEIAPEYVAVSLQRLHDMGLECELVS